MVMTVCHLSLFGLPSTPMEVLYILNKLNLECRLLGLATTIFNQMQKFPLGKAPFFSQAGNKQLSMNKTAECFRCTLHIFLHIYVYITLNEQLKYRMQVDHTQ